MEGKVQGVVATEMMHHLVLSHWCKFAAFQSVVDRLSHCGSLVWAGPTVTWSVERSFVRSGHTEWQYICHQSRPGWKHLFPPDPSSQPAPASLLWTAFMPECFLLSFPWYVIRCHRHISSNRKHWRGNCRSFGILSQETLNFLLLAPKTTSLILWEHGYCTRQDFCFLYPPPLPPSFFLMA